MRDNCFDLGTIQAFTDGELSSGRSERLLKHIAVCDACAALLAECEEESSFAYSVLDEQLNVLVPTERLRAKVFASIDRLENRQRLGWLNQIGAFFSINSPGFAAAASVVIVVGVIALGVSFYGPAPDTGSVAVNNSGPVNVDIVIPAEIESAPEQAELPPADTELVGADEIEEPGRPDGYRPIKTVYPEPVDQGSDSSNSADTAAAYETNIISEDSYLQTIATLDRTVRNNKEMLRPSERIAFERDLAVVNDAIVKMKDEVRRNPDNQAAREVLKASYQNKVDLLNSVAEKTELMASLQ
ncbi:MAG: zf-HC2 domain-containing protein [Acidobacteriota bacterium]|nr:MAG: zf-HC2 domain-containing protein [Acidobacteriota bacterium]